MFSLCLASNTEAFLETQLTFFFILTCMDEHSRHAYPFSVDSRGKRGYTLDIMYQPDLADSSIFEDTSTSRPTTPEIPTPALVPVSGSKSASGSRAASAKPGASGKKAPPSRPVSPRPSGTHVCVCVCVPVQIFCSHLLDDKVR